jgi:hypothetical protein
MGAWGAGSFQNDWALDWLGDLRESSDATIAYSTLRCVVEHGGTRHFPSSILERLRGRRRHTDWLDADVSARALAAAEIVAAWLGNPLSKLPDGTVEWLQQHSSSFQPDIVPLARQAVSIVKANSELKDLWEEGDANEWCQAIKNLEQRLQK